MYVKALTPVAPLTSALSQQLPLVQLLADEAMLREDLERLSQTVQACDVFFRWGDRSHDVDFDAEVAMEFLQVR